MIKVRRRQYCSTVTMKASLEGSTYALEFLAGHLPAGNVQVGREGEKFYLSSPRLDNLTGSSGLLLEVAEDLIESVNGLGRLLNPGFERIALTVAFTTNGDVSAAMARSRDPVPAMPGKGTPELNLG